MMILPKKSQKHLASFDSFLYNAYVADRKTFIRPLIGYTYLSAPDNGRQL